MKSDERGLIPDLLTEGARPGVGKQLDWPFHQLRLLLREGWGFTHRCWGGCVCVYLYIYIYLYIQKYIYLYIVMYSYIYLYIYI